MATVFNDSNFPLQQTFSHGHLLNCYRSSNWHQRIYVVNYASLLSKANV